MLASTYRRHGKVWQDEENVCLPYSTMQVEWKSPVELWYGDGRASGVQ